MCAVGLANSNQTLLHPPLGPGVMGTIGSIYAIVQHAKDYRVFAA